MIDIVKYVATCWNMYDEKTVMIKCCDIYYTPQKIFVSAVHRDVNGMTPCGEPMKLIRGQSLNGEIGDAVVASLYGSRDRMPENEGNLQTKKALDVLGERSFDNLSEEWDLIKVSFDERKNNVELFPMHRHTNGGFVSFNDDPIFSCKPIAAELDTIVLEIMHRPRLDTVSDAPSHT
jgi:hypothetical protein